MSTSKGPTWFDKDYIQNVLQSYFKDKSVQVVSYEAAPASNKGDNYVCILYRVQVKYKSDKCRDGQTASYILKVTLDNNGVVKAAFDSYGVYDHEIRMYDKILPILNAELQKGGIVEELAPRSICVNTEHQSILLADLKALGYEMVEVRTGYDIKHAKLVLRKLAIMHAASSVANAKNPGIFKDCDRALMNKYSRAFEIFFRLALETCAQAVGSWPGYEKYSEKMLKLLPHFLDYGARVTEAKGHHFNVMTHGDLWCNNVMIKYTGKEPVDVILLDFQFSAWTSPTIDLHYFFHIALKDEVRSDHLEDLLVYYYENLRNTLCDLKFTGKVPTLHQIWVQYMETMYFALFSMTISQPLLINEETEDASINCLMKDDERSRRLRDAMYRNERIQRNLRKWIPILDRYGILDLQP